LLPNLYAQGFTELSSTLNLQFGYTQGEYGGGVSFADFNGDGLDDLTYTTGLNQPMRFFENNGSGFTEIPSPIVNLNETKQVIWVDYNNDGYMDLYVTSKQGNRLYKNTGNLQMEDITATAGFSDPVNAQSFCASWFDYDQDGLTDFCVSFRTAYLMGKITLYRNLGNDMFEDVTTAAGLGGLGNSVLGMATFDMNNDGLEDLFVGQDFQAGCLMLKNNGDGTFSNISVSSGANVQNNTMTVTIGDYDGDGWMDVYLTNTAQGNTLLRNNGDETFTNTAFTAGLTMNMFTWGALFLDADNDQDLDIHVNATSSSNMFENTAIGMPFVLVNAAWGFAGYSQNCIGLAGGDYNNDGYVDMAKNNSNSNNTFWQNNFTGNNFLSVFLTGTISNFNAIGAVIEISANGISQKRRVGCGEGFSSQNSFTQYFGLGTAQMVDTLNIYWPSGLVNTYLNVEANQKLNLIEFEEITGCTDALACNFNPVATNEDGSCEYAVVYFDCQGNCLMDTDDDGVCDELEIIGCTDPVACNFNPEATENSFICTYAVMYYDCSGTCLSDIDEDGICDELEIAGCTDVLACNFNPSATDAVNICIYPPNVSITGNEMSYEGDTETYSVNAGEEVILSWSVTGNNTILSDINNAEIDILWAEAGVHTVSVIAMIGDDCVGEIETFNVEVISSVGLPELTSFSITIFPNPASETLHVQSNIALASIEIYNLSGKLILANNDFRNHGTIHLKNIENGSYLLKITSINGSQSLRKIVVLR
jgi:hypothetical protein